MVVLDMESIPPKKMELVKSMSSNRPTPKPAKVMPVIMMNAVNMADVPELTSFLKLNSRPRVNISMTIPSSAQKSMLSKLLIEGR